MLIPVSNAVSTSTVYTAKVTFVCIIELHSGVNEELVILRRPRWGQLSMTNCNWA